MTTPRSPDATARAADPSAGNERARAAGALADEFFRRERAGEQPDPFEFILAHSQVAAELEQLLGGAAERYLASQSHPLAELRPAMLPTVIGRYHVREMLGAGSSAVVYRAFDPKVEREVALKVVRADAAVGSSAAGRFDRDARTLAR